MESLVNAFVFSREYLRAALLVSLLSIWLLVVLFFYLNRYTKRPYFTAWTAAWLFYALWLTVNLQAGSGSLDRVLFSLGQCSVAASSVFLFWGSLLFLKIPVRQRLFGLFMVFVIVWSLTGPRLMSGPFQLEMPVFLLIGAGSVFAAACFFRLQRRTPFVGAGMLAVGFLLWGIYLVTYPISRRYEGLFSAGFFMAAVIQLFIAISMVVLVLEESRLMSQEALEQMAMINAEKETLQRKVITAEEQCLNLYDQVRAHEGKQRAYEELRETQDLIVQQERLRAVGLMTSGLVHDLNNLLTPIKGYAELLLGSDHLVADHRLMVVRVKQAADSIANIVRRMRDFYRPRSPEDRMELVNVNQLIDEAVELARPRWRDLPLQSGVTIEIQRDLDRQLAPLVSDATELRQALINLIFNAVDALPSGGTITLATQCVELNGAEPAATRSAVRIEVRDTGVGMDATTRQRCLEPFFSTKAKRGGTGLGLAMVYGMVQRHHGEIDIQSLLGSGTCVRLTLPLHSSPNDQPAPEPLPSDGQQSPLRVLYVDDEPLVRSVISDCLRSFKHDVRVASSGVAGLEMVDFAKQSQQPFDAIITDLGMPEMNGIEFAREIKARSPLTPVIMLSGWGDMTAAVDRNDRTVDAILSKPTSPKDLNDALWKVTASSTRHSRATPGFSVARIAMNALL